MANNVHKTIGEKRLRLENDGWLYRNLSNVLATGLIDSLMKGSA